MHLLIRAANLCQGRTKLLDLGRAQFRVLEPHHHARVIIIPRDPRERREVVVQRVLVPGAKQPRQFARSFRRRTLNFNHRDARLALAISKRRNGDAGRAGECEQDQSK